jgi:NAD+ diphosphatase
MSRVAVGIIRKSIEGKDAYLLVASKSDFGSNSGKYYPPGGHVEAGEDDVACLRRELREELALDLKKAKLISETASDVPDQITAWYECEVASFELHIDREEIADARYCTREEMKKLRLWPATEKFFRNYTTDR